MKSKLSFSLRKRFWQPLSSGSEILFSQFSSQWPAMDLLIKLFYAANFGVWLLKLRYWGDFNSVVVLDPVWPLIWAYQFLSPVKVLWICYFINIIFSLIAMIFPQKKLARILAFLGLFFLSAAHNSDIAGWQRLTEGFEFVLISFLFIFLTYDQKNQRRKVWNFGFIIALSQITIIWSYGCSAIWRIRFAAYSLFYGQPTTLDWGVLQDTISYMKNNNGAEGILSNLFIEHSFLNGPGLLFATFAELSTLYFIFKPRFYRMVGIELVIFHFGVVLIYNFAFEEHLLVMSLFLLGSPFIYNGKTHRKTG